MSRNVMITLTMDEYQSVLTALKLSRAYYIGAKDELPNVDKWRASERAMSAADMQMLHDNIVEQVA